MEPLAPIELNIPLLRKTMEYIEAHPEDWDQMHYAMKSEESSCGTAMCFAGTAVYLEGYSFVFHRLSGRIGEVVAVDCTKQGNPMLIDHKARELLGLTETQADEIFGAVHINDPVRMRKHVEDVIGVKL